MSNLEERVVKILSNELACHDATSLTDLIEFVEAVFTSDTQLNIKPFTIMDCFRRVIHIFSLFPSYLEVSILNKILFTSLFTHPAHDFQEIIHLFPSAIQVHPLIRPLIFLQESLQTGRFKLAWEYLDDPSISDLTINSNYADKLRKCIIPTIKISYRSLPVREFCSLLHLEIDSPKFHELLNTYQWKLENNSEGESIVIINDASKFIPPATTKHKSYFPRSSKKGSNVKSGKIDTLEDYYFMLKGQAM